MKKIAHVRTCIKNLISTQEPFGAPARTASSVRVFCSFMHIELFLNLIVSDNQENEHFTTNLKIRATAGEVS